MSKFLLMALSTLAISQAVSAKPLVCQDSSKQNAFTIRTEANGDARVQIQFLKGMVLRNDFGFLLFRSEAGDQLVLNKKDTGFYSDRKNPEFILKIINANKVSVVSVATQDISTTTSGVRTYTCQ